MNKVGIARTFFPVMIALAMLLQVGCVRIDLSPTPRSGQLTQKLVKPGEGFSNPRLLLVDVSGVIGIPSSSSLFGRELDMLTLLSETFQKATEDSSIKVVVLRIDSPGGGVTASDIIYNEVMKFRKARPDVKVQAQMIGTAASGGYYIAAAADDIAAHPTTVTGSIGVIAQFPSFKRLTDTIGYEHRAFKSGPNKDIGSPFKDFTPEQKEIMQGMIDDMYARFVEVVDTGRPKLGRERVLELADGRIYTAQKALANGLIDRIEYLPETIQRLENETNSSFDIVTYDPIFNLGSSLYTSRMTEGSASTGAPSVPTRVEVRHTFAGLPESLAPGFYYLWME